MITPGWILSTVLLATITGAVSWAFLMFRVSTIRDRLNRADAISSRASVDAAERLSRLAAQAHSLRQTRALLESVSEQSPIGLIACNTERIVWANAAAECETGLTTEQMVSHTFWQLVHPDDRASGVEIVDENIASGRTLHGYRNRWVHPVTKKIVHLSWVITPYENGLAYCTVRREQGAE